MAIMQAIQANPRTLERRRHQRVRVTLLGRFMLENRQEFPCQTVDMSPGGLALFAPVRGKLGERVVIYLEHLGRVEGTIVREYERGFAVALSATKRKQDKLASQLTWFANRQELGLPEDRRHERITPRSTGALMRTPDGAEIGVRIIDVSLSGAAVSSPVKPPLGSPVSIGATSGKVVRHFDGGIAIEFLRTLSDQAFDENVQL
ncbi:PilZ domain-containing protein [Alsobacter metallidurans]|nr:PilZ domain-containing protein [Alsobacter metallidurans]